MFCLIDIKLDFVSLILKFVQISHFIDGTKFIGTILEK